MTKGKPKRVVDAVSGTPKITTDPDSYLQMKPVWRFSSFDWDGPWGLIACEKAKWRMHVEQHLASFESMTWDEILKASGGKKKGNNNHHIDRGKFTKSAKDRLEKMGILGDTLFSLRLESCIRIYGIRVDNCLRILWFDPFHCDKKNGTAAYAW
jgi:hypothetical protein